VAWGDHVIAKGGKKSKPCGAKCARCHGGYLYGILPVEEITWSDLCQDLTHSAEKDAAFDRKCAVAAGEIERDFTDQLVQVESVTGFEVYDLYDKIPEDKFTKLAQMVGPKSCNLKTDTTISPDGTLGAKCVHAASHGHEFTKLKVFTQVVARHIDYVGPDKKMMFAEQGERMQARIRQSVLKVAPANQHAATKTFTHFDGLFSFRSPIIHKLSFGDIESRAAHTFVIFAHDSFQGLVMGAQQFHCCNARGARFSFDCACRLIPIILERSMFVLQGFRPGIAYKHEEAQQLHDARGDAYQGGGCPQSNCRGLSTSSAASWRERRIGRTSSL
jgi:hypothetical protein